MILMAERAIGRRIVQRGGHVTFYSFWPWRIRVVIATTVEDAMSLRFCKSLQLVDVRDLAIGDEGVQPLLRSKALIGIFLAGTRVTSRTVSMLGSMKKLKFVGLERNGLSIREIEALRAQLPECYVYSDDHELDLANRFCSEGLQIDEVRIAFSSIDAAR